MSLHHIAKNGVLRVAINTGNRALVQLADGVLAGVSPALGMKLARDLGIRFEPIIYDGAGKVFGDAHNDKWDVGFLAIDAKRAQKVAFTRPYVSIEATYAVRAGSGIAAIEDVDKDHNTVLTALGSAYDMHLTANLKHAQLEKFGTPAESFKAFQDGRCDAVAGVRESLAAFFADDPDIHLLDGVLTAVRQAMVLPNPTNPTIDVLDAFVAERIADGFVAQAFNAR